MTRGTRLPPEFFKIPLDEIRSGYYTDKYFLRTRQTLVKDGRNPIVFYQLFTRLPALVAGLDEAIAILKTCSGEFQDGRWVSHWPKLSVCALYDGDAVEPWETLLSVEGPIQSICTLETLLLGVIARPTSIATAVRANVRAANGKPVLFFSARFDHHSVQSLDGHAARVAGVTQVSTDAGAAWWGGQGIGTMPHALIAAYHGDTRAAAEAFDRHIEPGVARIVLVDWDNDCIGTSIQVIEGFRSRAGATPEEVDKFIGSGPGRVWGVRFDTASTLRDVSVAGTGPESYGVSAELVVRARVEFDRRGWQNLKIVASGGFNSDKIASFEKARVPADVYAVGSDFLRHKVDITADIVRVDGKPCAKVGRSERPDPRLEVVT